MIDFPKFAAAGIVVLCGAGMVYKKYKSKVGKLLAAALAVNGVCFFF